MLTDRTGPLPPKTSEQSCSICGLVVKVVFVTTSRKIEDDYAKTDRK